MISMMEDFIGTYGNNLIVAVVGVGVALLVLAIALWLLRRRSGSSPFIRGGRNRQPRLQVLDATAVDARRRLVLVRRDNVEHLVMIGGPTDIVTSEKQCFGHFVDGRASFVVGTHTHVPTADAQIL
ncbi:YmdB family metallophosphoesterase, partial [Agrobacterium fabrum]|uniref:YmdB family metallophosphoesterase n=1 Tax=Agrobacterium fabrum TaxID=1176649 RepID=UPI0015D46E61